jgi:3'-5' exoribonuclease
MIRKKQFISEFKANDIVDDIFVIKNKRPVEQYKNGFKFELRIADSTKAIQFKYWGGNDEAKIKALYDSLSPDDVIHVKGKINEWNNMFEISSGEKYEIVKLKQGDFDVTDFIKRSQYNVDNMWSELMQIKDTIKDESIKAVVNHFFNDEEFSLKFKTTPAAMYIHHGWVSGLLEHTLAVTKIALGICEIHKDLNKDYVIAGSMLHDMAKIQEYQMTTNITTTVEGNLIGHVSIASNLLFEGMKFLNTPEEVRIKLLHIVITHMGEYGSSKLPATPEALAVHLADYTDGNLTHMENIIAEAPEEEDFVYNKDLGNVYRR